MQRKRLIIIDANAVIHRGFHALPRLTSKTGEVVNALYGFLLFFFKAVREFSPDYIAATFDYPAPTFRKEKYELYKANREKAPDELYNQIPKVKKVLGSFGVAVFEKKGFEADDIIGTISKEVSQKGIEVIILTGDMDVLQLVDKYIKVYALKRGIKDAVLFDETETIKKYGGLLPEQLVDFKSLRGDPSDNIPGVSGIGEKTAVSLIKKYGSIEEIYRRIESGKIELNPALREKLVKDKDKAMLSKELSEIYKETPIEFDLKKCEWKGYNKEEGLKELEVYGFNSLIERIKKETESPQKTNNLILL